MSVEEIRAVLGWSFIINYAILLVWFVFLVYARDWVYSVHSKWFPLTREQFTMFHYGMMGGYKMLVIVFNLTPYLALRILA